jgi:hypothetical protein
MEARIEYGFCAASCCLHCLNATGRQVKDLAGKYVLE